MHRPRYEFRQRRRELQKVLLIASTVFVVLPLPSLGQSASMQSNPGELPASPWDHRGPNAARSTPNTRNASSSTRRTVNSYIQQPSSKKSTPATTNRTEEVIASPQPILQPPVPISSSPQPEFRLDQPTSTERPSGLGAPIEFPIDTPKSTPEEIRPLESSQGELLISGQWNTLPRSGLILTSEQTELEEPLAEGESIDLRQSGTIKPAQPIGLPPVPKKEAPPSTPVEVNSTASAPKTESITQQSNDELVIAPTVEKPKAPPNERSYLERKQEALDQERLKIGQKVSTHILADSNAPSDPPPPAIEPPNGWNAIKDQLQTHLRQCDEYLRRGATHTARQEALFGLRLLFRALDQRRNAWTSEPDLDQALTAFREEADFHASMRNPEMARSVASIVATHQTPVLKSTDLTNMAPEIAAQYYRYFAKDRLVEAAERHVWAADLFYSYGNAWRSKPPKMRSSARCCWRNRSRVIEQHWKQPRTTPTPPINLAMSFCCWINLMLPKWRSSIASRFNRRPASIGTWPNCTDAREILLGNSGRYSNRSN